MKSSIIIVLFFVVGMILGILEIVPDKINESELSLYALSLLMLFVGINIGSDFKILKNIRAVNPRFLLLPIVTIVGTLIGCTIYYFIFPVRELTDYLAIGSGFGYYSLSSIFITEYRGIELGTLALLANILREIITLLLAPLLVRHFGKLAIISSGGATTMDTTLPVIVNFSGRDFVILALFHGFVVDLAVPFLVTFFCTL